jgi:glycosyltransferase EpsD
MGVPMPREHAEEGAIRRKYANDGDFVILFVGELSARKNQEFLIRQMPAIKEKIPGIRLWLVGEGGEEKHLRALVEELELGDRVVFLGKRRHPGDYMRGCDVYVSPSESEGLPFNIVEALGCGKTVLASRVKGHTDILENGAGYLFNLSVPQEFGEKLYEIYAHGTHIPEERIAEGYHNFSDAVVFNDTYEKLMEASEL